MNKNNTLLKNVIIVIGSKPNARFPAIPASFVFTANNAVELGIEYRRRYGSQIIALVHGKEFSEHEHIRQSFVKSQPDEIIFLGRGGLDDPATFIHKALNLKSKVTIVDYYEYNWIWTDVMGWRRFLVVLECMAARGIKSIIKQIIPDMIIKKKYNWMCRSTGLNAIFYAMRRFPTASEIIVSGIGLQGGFHFHGAGEFRNKTAKVDRNTVKHWLFKKRINVYTTDDMMNKIGNFPKYNGEVFFKNE